MRDHHDGLTVKLSNRRDIINHASGETFEVIKTSADTDGEYAEAIMSVPAGFKAIPLHRHPLQSEVITVLEGRLGAIIDGEIVSAKTGESVVIPQGSAHQWWNTGDGILKASGKITPALHFSELLSTLYDSANHRNSVDPNLLDAAYILIKYKDEYDPIFLPKPMRLIGIPLLYAVGKVLGRHRLIEKSITASHYI